MSERSLDPLDIDTAIAFIERRFANDRTGYAILMFRPPNGGAPIHLGVPLQQDDRWDLARRYVADHIENHDCYLSVANFATAPTGKKGQNRTKEMVGHLSALFCDRDEASLDPHLPEPTQTAETSAGNFQDYWDLDRPINADTAERYNRRIAAACGIGNQAVDAPRVLRLPGTRNHKPERRGEIVRVVTDTGHTYQLTDFDHLPTVITEQPRPVYTNISTADSGAAWTKAEPLLGARMLALANGDDTILRITPQGAQPYAGASERRAAVITALLGVGLTDSEADAAFRTTARWRELVGAHGEEDALRRLRTQDIPNAKRFLANRAPLESSQAANTKQQEGRAVDPETGEILEANAPPTREASTDRARPPSDASFLIQLTADMEFFHTPTDDRYVSYERDMHRETHPLGRGSRFKEELARRFYTQKGRPPSTNAMTSAMPIFEDRAYRSAPAVEVYTRVGKHEGAIYIDLADKDWRAIEIKADGWRVVHNPPVRFRRAKGMLPLPDPACGGHLSELRPFINVPDDENWALVAAWLVMAVHPDGPYPILDIHGEQGSAKTTTTKRLRQVIDPARPLTRAQPKEERDLMIAAKNSRIIAIDNVSHLPSWLSDAHCRIATGAGFGARSLYTDDEEQLFDGKLPQILTAIEEVATRGDFLDRSIIVNLPSIPANQRIPEEKTETAFLAAHPRILGGLCDALTMALRRAPTVHLPELPRMADFALWAVAAEPALGIKKGSFLTAYAQNRENAVGTELEASAIGSLILALAREQDESGWSGTIQDLLAELTRRADATGDDVRWHKGWPTQANKLSGMLTRLAPALRTSGVIVETKRTKTGKAVALRLADQDLAFSVDRMTMGDDQISKGDDQISKGDDQISKGDDQISKGDDQIPKVTMGDDQNWGDRHPQTALHGHENARKDHDGDDGDDQIPTLPPWGGMREEEKEREDKSIEGRVANLSSPSSPSSPLSCSMTSDARIDPPVTVGEPPLPPDADPLTIVKHRQLAAYCRAVVKRGDEAERLPDHLVWDTDTVGFPAEKDERALAYARRWFGLADSNNEGGAHA